MRHTKEEEPIYWDGIIGGWLPVTMTEAELEKLIEEVGDEPMST